MDSKDLTTTQAKELGERIRPMLRYVGTDLERMTRRGFAVDDPLLDATSHATAG
jgi:hypothetical protein